jgi:hypothetical protein
MRHYVLNFLRDYHTTHPLNLLKQVERVSVRVIEGARLILSLCCAVRANVVAMSGLVRVTRRVNSVNLLTVSVDNLMTRNICNTWD